MSGQWQIVSAPVAGSQATVTLAATANAGTSGQQIRVRSLSAFFAAIGAAQSAVFQVRSSATVIYSAPIVVLSGDSKQITVSNLDLRVTAGYDLTVEFAAAPAGSHVEAVQATGDYVSVGSPYGNPTGG